MIANRGPRQGWHDAKAGQRPDRDRCPDDDGRRFRAVRAHRKGRPDAADLFRDPDGVRHLVRLGGIMTQTIIIEVGPVLKTILQTTAWTILLAIGVWLMFK